MKISMMRFFSCFLLLLLGINLRAQTGIQYIWEASPEEFDRASKSIVVLKNSSQLLPISNLDDLDFRITGVVTLDLVDMTTRYVNTRRHGMRAHKVLFANLNRLLPEGQIEEIMAEANGGKLILNLGGGGLIYLDHVISKKADAVITSEIDNTITRSLALQIAFGSHTCSNRLKNNLGNLYLAGEGVSVETLGRLGYSIPEAADIDRKILWDSTRTIVQEGLAHRAYPGAQVVVARYGNVIYHEVFGRHTYEDGRPVNHHNIYDLASVTKVSTATTAVMKLYDEGLFNLEGTIGQDYPDFAKSNKGDLVWRPVLAHHARLQAWIPFWRDTKKKNGNFRRSIFRTDSTQKFNVYITDELWMNYKYRGKMMKAIRKTPLNEEAGYLYSGLPFYILPQIIERKTGQHFEDYLKHNFYEPVGAYTITFNPMSDFPLERIIPTERDTFFRNIQIHGRVHDEGAIMMGGVNGNAGLFSTSYDLAKLAQMWLNKGEYGGRKILQSSTVEEFTRCQYCEENNRRGLGFDKPMIEYDPDVSSVAKSASPSSFGHTGYTGTLVWVDPEYDLIYIFFCNRVYPSRDSREIYDRAIRPRIHEAIYDAIRKYNIDHPSSEK